MLRLLLASPLLLILVLFALSNRDPVRMGFWPTDYSFEPPLSAAILVAMAAAFLLGALLVWGGTLAQRRRARRAERRVRVLEAQVEALRAREREAARAAPVPQLPAPAARTLAPMPAADA